VGFEGSDVWGYISYVKWRDRSAKFGSNLGDFMVYIKDKINNKVKKVTKTMKEAIWTGLKAEMNSDVELCVGSTYNAPRGFQW
jgi:hypothetical protein